jgi:hypothetical protein
MTSPTLVLPPGVVQPFDLHRLHDDLHVMAFFDGHPVYEAVEAMIRRSADGPAAIRAILTRHDQTQIDHVNDDDLYAAARLSPRQTCRREIAFVEDRAAACPRARVAFESHAGEAVVLDLTSASPPAAARGGLSDPGRHAEGSSLPLMWRGRSALAGPASKVSIDGIAWPIPVKLRGAAGFVAHHGFFTEAHDMLILRAGTVASTVLEQPGEWKVGTRWTYSRPDGNRSYRITHVTPEGAVRLSGRGDLETLHGRRRGDRLELHRIDVLAAGATGRRASLVFEPDGRFHLALDGASGSVDGDVRLDADGAMHLLPREPAWATARAVHVRISRSGDRIEVAALIG